MNIQINDTFAHVSYKKNNVDYAKTITVDTLVSSLVSQYGVRTPLLPPGCRFYEKRGESHILFLELPPIPRVIRYINRDSKVIFEGLVPFPWALLKFSALATPDGTYSISGGSIYALKRPLISEQDEIYHFPAANVHSNDTICWGRTFSTVGNSFRSLGETGRLVDLYFSSDFNTDLHPSINKYNRYEDMLRDIRDQKTFPVEVLVPTGSRFSSLVGL